MAIESNYVRGGAWTFVHFKRRLRYTVGERDGQSRAAGVLTSVCVLVQGRLRWATERFPKFLLRMGRRTARTDSNPSGRITGGTVGREAGTGVAGLMVPSRALHGPHRITL